ncbi:hypothetical protein [Aquimarina sp. MMG016]|uniref:hypothetical protein n=1 Tax=Aquimarina sp. MMG016 TaxID=2822690 RepID=UPI001B3A622D|nr:hypothetical protein [Aquimarina sp. MMG016]MBQ4819957.1 hypothetical protein [Aquimarina sp. MMG016]
MKWLFSFFISITIHAQSTFDKSFDTSEVEEVEIVLHNTFEIEIINNIEDKVIFNGVSEGEYENDILIKAKQYGKRIVLEDEIQPFSENHNDKLSAHKVFVVKVKLQIPDHLNVVIKSRIASLDINGEFKNLFAELDSGDCLLNSFIGNATINTLSGNINVFTENANIITSTKSGKINSENITGAYQINLKSISGNISVYKTK